MVEGKKILVGVQDLEQYLGLDRRRIQQLENEGVVKKLERGKYDLQVSVRKYIESLRRNRPGRNDQLTKLREEEMEIQNRIAMMEFLEKNEVLVQAEAVRLELIQVLKAFQVSVRELPTVLAKELYFVHKDKARETVEGTLSDQEGTALFHKRLTAPINDRLKQLATLENWKKK